MTLGRDGGPPRCDQSVINIGQIPPDKDEHAPMLCPNTWEQVHGPADSRRKMDPQTHRRAQRSRIGDLDIRGAELH
jgi:hypothetical protein